MLSANRDHSHCIGKELSYMTYEMKIREERKDAVRQSNEKIILNLLKNGISTLIIAVSMGKTPEEIEKIAQLHHARIAN